MKKVSIITPCYNGEKFVGRYLESVLNQTYKNIEMILVNDGSTDRTEEVVLEYKTLFEEKGMDFIYIYQENAGQATALNKGLAIFTGDYLTWPDSDDILTSDSIEKKVNFLDNNLKYGFVRSDAVFVNEGKIDDIQGYFSQNTINKNSEDIFLPLILETMYLCCGCYMVRREAFIDVNPKREIYNTRAGQNWQMLLPISYKYRCGYIDEVLYKYVIREESHSHRVITMEDQLKRCDDHEDILYVTINSMSLTLNEKKEYLTIVKEKYMRKKLYLASNFKNKPLALEQFKLLKVQNNVKRGDYLYYIMSQNQILFIIVKGILKIKSFLG